MQIDNNKRLKGFSARDVNRINHEDKHHVVRRWHNSFIAHKFNVGDIVMYADQLPYNKLDRFQVVEVNDLFTFIKPIKQNGDLGKRMLNLADYYSKFVLDPLYVDHLMFNSDLSTFDPMQHVKNYKKQKEQIKRNFYKQYKKYKNFKFLMKKFISTLHVGDIFYMGTASYFYECRLISYGTNSVHFDKALNGNNCFITYSQAHNLLSNSVTILASIDEPTFKSTYNCYFSKTLPVLDIDGALCK